MFVREVKTADGAAANVPVATYTHIDQYWPFTEAQFASFKYTYKNMKGSLTDCTKVLAKQ